MHQPGPHRISIVIPVYQGARTLPAVMNEIAPFMKETISKAGHRFSVSEIILVHDCGPDNSDQTIQELVKKIPCIKPVWLSKNFGQHPATLAGMSCSTGDWIVTMDEDGQQNPTDISALLDAAIQEGAQLVYARPLNTPPHGFLRNFLSKSAKKIATILLGNREIGYFNSFRFIRGDIARSLAAYCGNGVFLDVALFWIAGRVSQCGVILRREQGRPSGYSLKKLFGHFWQLLLTSGTRPLRLITVMGFSSLIFALLIALYALWEKYYVVIPVQGWASIVIVVAFFSGCILMSLGVIAEYMAVTMSIAMGKPLYVVVPHATSPRTKT